MSLMFRRGTTGQQQSPTFVPDNGEPIWDYEAKKLWIGDANTAGGNEVAMVATLSTLAGVNLDYNGLTKAIDLNLTGVTTNSIAEGTNNKYFSPTLAQAAVGAALIAGNPSNTGITFAYDDVDDKITAVVSGGGGSGVMGGNLSSDLILNGFDITGTGDITITGNHALTGNLTGTGNITRTGNITLTGNQSISGIIYALDGSLAVGSNSFPSTVNVISDLPNIAQFTGLTTVDSALYVDVNVSAGTLASPTAPLEGSELGGYRVQLWNGTAFVTSAVLQANVSNDANMGSSNPQTDLILGVANNNSFSLYTFGGSGQAVFPGTVQLGSYTDTQRNALTPAVGMMIYNTTANKFQGYQNTGGTTLEWVDIS
jgi:hypothetical protein